MSKHKARILQLIGAEISRVENEIDDIEDSVNADIDELLLEHSQQSVQTGSIEDFRNKHFDILKRRKKAMLRKSLDKLKALHSTVSIECKACESPQS